MDNTHTYNVLYTTGWASVGARYQRAHNNRLKKERQLGQGMFCDCRPWLQQVRDFINVFGKAAVPGDVRRASNYVEMG